MSNQSSAIVQPPRNTFTTLRDNLFLGDNSALKLDAFLQCLVYPIDYPPGSSEAGREAA